MRIQLHLLDSLELLFLKQVQENLGLPRHITMMQLQTASSLYMRLVLCFFVQV